MWGDTAVATVGLLGALAQRLPRAGDVVLEFGTFRGFTTRVLAENARAGVRVVTVDWGDARSHGFCDPHAIFRTACYSDGGYRTGEFFLDAPQRVRRRIRQVTGDSRHMNLSAYAGRVALAFVDGGHSEEVVCSDARLALRLLRPGGAILFDDVNEGWPGVERCLERLRSEDGLTVHRMRPSSVAYYRRCPA